VRQAKYDYYGSSDTGGSPNDLKRATIQQWNGGSWDTLGVFIPAGGWRAST
jgi:hypothetical protein